MKKFTEPDLELTVFRVEEIVTTSFSDSSASEGEPIPGVNGTPIG